MKKLLALTLFASLVIASCSSDEGGNSKSSTAKATIDGVTYTFNTFAVSQETFTDNDFTYTDVTITGSIDSNPSRTFTMIVEKGATGPDASYYFAYFLNDLAHEKTPAFLTNITTSSTNRLTGTFSGEVVADDGSNDSLTISNGSFDIFY